MEPIEIIKNKSELEGTCYIELSLGKYQGKHWEDTSLFFDEEIFGFIEAIFEKHIPDYDHYSINDAGVDSWKMIISELRVLGALGAIVGSANEFNDIVGKVGFSFGGTRDNFHFCKLQLHNLIIELVEWAEENMKTLQFWVSKRSSVPNKSMLFGAIAPLDSLTLAAN